MYDLTTFEVVFISGNHKRRRKSRCHEKNWILLWELIANETDHSREGRERMDLDKKNLIASTKII